MNFFQPSFKLAEKQRNGAQVTKRYYPPATPHQRLLADPRTPDEVRRRLNAMAQGLDPVGLLREIRATQQRLVEIADRPIESQTAVILLQRLSSSLSGCAPRGKRARCARPRARNRLSNGCADGLILLRRSRRNCGPGSKPSPSGPAANCLSGSRPSLAWLQKPCFLAARPRPAKIPAACARRSREGRPGRRTGAGFQPNKEPIQTFEMTRHGNKPMMQREHRDEATLDISGAFLGEATRTPSLPIHGY